jgi:hypothetical protein
MELQPSKNRLTETGGIQAADEGAGLVYLLPNLRIHLVRKEGT